MTEDFWDWLPKAYGDVGDEATFTKYNMEVAFAAGAEAEKRTWVGLTDEEIYAIEGVEMKYDGTGEYYLEGEYEFAKAIEAKLKHKNT